MSPTAAPPLNNFSSQLQALLNAALPQPGETLIFERFHRAEPQQALNEEGLPVQWQGTPNGFRIPRLETIIDPGTGLPITIANLLSWSPSGPFGQPEPVVGEIRFTPGQSHRLYVSADDPVLAARLLLSDKNKDSINPRKRTPEGGHVFGLVRPAVAATASYEFEMQVADALQLVRGLESGDGASISPHLASAVDKLNIPTEDRGRQLTEKELLSRVAAVAKVEPARIGLLVDGAEARLEKLVASAEALGLVDFVEEAQQWRWKSNQEAITEAVQGYKPQQALVRYIQMNANGAAFSRMLAGKVKQEEEKAKGGGKK